MTHCTFQFFMGGLGDFTVPNFSLLAIQSKGTALRMGARNGELFFCRSLSLATRQHPPPDPHRALPLEGPADSGVGTFVCGTCVSERRSFPGTPSPLAPLRPPTRVPGAAGPELPGSSLLQRHSSGQARVRSGPRPRSPPDPRGCCTGYGGRDGGRSLAWAGREAGRALGVGRGREARKATLRARERAVWKTGFLMEASGVGSPGDITGPGGSEDHGARAPTARGHASYEAGR